MTAARAARGGVAGSGAGGRQCGGGAQNALGMPWAALRCSEGAGGGLTSNFRSLLVPVAARAGGRIDDRRQREQVGSVARAAVPAVVNAGGMRRMRWACGGRRRRGKRGAEGARTLRGGDGALPIAVGARRPRRAAQWQRHGCAGPEAAQKRAPGSTTRAVAWARVWGPSWLRVQRGAPVDVGARISAGTFVIFFGPTVAVQG